MKQTKTTLKELTAAYRAVLKHAAFAAMGLALSVGTASAYTATTDVDFAGKYTKANGDTANVSDPLAPETYSYEASDGTTVSGVAYDEEPDLSKFTYLDKDGNSLDLNTEPQEQSEYTGLTAATGDVETTQSIVAGATMDRANYTYKNGAGETVTLGETAQNMSVTQTLSTEYTGGAVIEIVNGEALSSNGEALSSLDGTMYSGTLPEGNTVYYLNADGTALLYLDDVVVTPDPGSPLEDLFNNMQTAYLNDKSMLDTNIATTADNWTTEQTNFATADGVFNTDSNTVNELNSRFETIATAQDLLNTANENKASAATQQEVEHGLYTAASDVFNASIQGTINSGANVAITDALDENGAIANAIADEATARADADTVLDGKIAAEETARIAADNELDGKITAEETARIAADNELDGKITDEATARIAADNALQTNIDMSLAEAKAYTDVALQTAKDYTDRKVDSLEKHMSAGIASANALSAVAVSNVKKGEVSVGGGYGYYNSQSAMALGAAMGITDNWSVNAGAGFADSNISLRAGTNYKFKLF